MTGWPPISLAKLSHDCAGNPHFFDLDTVAGARLISAVAEITGQTEPTRPDLARALLLDAGVIADRLTATVLLYQMAAVGQGPIDRRLRDSATPVALTLLDLTLNPPTLANQVLTVVENPSIIEAAMASGSRLPLACTSGQLSSVDHALAAPAELIAMDIATVSAAGPAPSAVPLNPPPQPADTKLATALQISGRVIFQENDAILDQLLGHIGHEIT